MSEGAFFQPRRISPTGLTLVILLHGAAITALAMSKMDVFHVGPRAPTKVTLIPDPPDPPPEPQKPQQQPATKPQQMTYQKPIIEIPTPRPIDLESSETIDPPRPYQLDGPENEVLPEPKPMPKPEPKPEPIPRTEAKLDSRSQLQPPYPLSEREREAEGTVSIRLVIGADGRVKAVEKLRATSAAFYEATERHVLRHWRFKPATENGKPVESRKLMSVRFTLDG